ncbi:TrkA family potassium uptake protein [Thermocrinis sp.]|jgi:trk system potassium uptake protein TrkA|uniref:potassium channel family protein n=2 Tax=Thermocrinis sp. TaxID=2024383 RepID=UPI00263550ED|nr:TrkA family potassium uptake protein [Thermocrinis sp.]
MKRKNRTFGVIGLGRFGYHVARTLAQGGAEVIACDVDEEKVREISEYVSLAYVLDATDAKALKESGIANVDTAVVSIGENIEASILIVVQLKELGVKEIVAKAVNPLHGKVLEKLGVDRVVYPEKEMAIRVAHSLLAGEFIEEIPIGEKHSLFELKAFDFMLGKTLRELDVRKRFGVSVLAIKRGENLIVNPMGDEKILPGDILVVLGTTEQLSSMASQ